MIKVIAILTIICMLLGAAVGAGIYFYKDSDSSSDSSSNGSSNNSNVDSSLDSSSSSTGDSSSDMGSGVAGESSSGVDGLDDSGGTTSSRGGLTGPPPPPAPGEYTELASSAKPVCDPALCTGDKVLKSTTKKGSTIDECCRDKACEVDWNPDAGGDPEQCRVDGMIFDEDIPNPDGKTNAECCKKDTTSYSKWCVQDVAYKKDGSTEKTRSPAPWRGGGGDHWKQNYRAGSKDWHKTDGDPLRNCKKECDKESDCHAFWLRDDGYCRLQKRMETTDGLHSGFEKNNDKGSGTYGDHKYSGDFYIKSTFVPDSLRVINGKIAGVDEEYCALNYTSVFGNEAWDTAHLDNGGHHEGKHIVPVVSHRSCPGSAGCDRDCFAPGATVQGVKLGTSSNSKEPMVNLCSQVCDKYDDCGGFFVVLNGPNAGRCCLKNAHTPSQGKDLYLTSNRGGSYFVRVNDGVMGVRPWRKSINSPKSGN